MIAAEEEDLTKSEGAAKDEKNPQEKENDEHPVVAEHSHSISSIMELKEHMDLPVTVDSQMVRDILGVRYD